MVDTPSVGGMSRDHLEGNIARSREHVAKQEAIIATLKKQGHTQVAEQAITVLEAMNEHLRIELELLDTMLRK
jgi:hypothetical protein